MHTACSKLASWAMRRAAGVSLVGNAAANPVGNTLPVAGCMRVCACVLQARITSLGGKVVHKGGSHRVMGLLAMTRAIGDHFLRPYVISEPEVGEGSGNAGVQSAFRVLSTSHAA